MERIDIVGENEISVKRLYLPVVIKTKCPHCNKENERDFEGDYLSYPITNVKENMNMYCESCDNEYEFDIVLKIALEVDMNMRKL